MGPSPPCCSPRTTEPSDPAEPWGLAITPPGLPRLAHHARADASRCAPLARRRRRRGLTAVSFASTAMARPLFPAQPGHGPVERQCPICLVSDHLLGKAGQLLRVLFLELEGQIFAEPHNVPGGEAPILATNHRVAVSPGPGAGPLGTTTGSDPWVTRLLEPQTGCRDGKVLELDPRNKSSPPLRPSSR